MRLIGTLPTEYDARRLGDFLLSLGLPNHVEAVTAGNAWMLWIERDDDVEQGSSRLREYQANPNDPRYDDSAAKARTVRRDAEKLADRRRRNFTDVRTNWSGARSRPTPVAIVMIVLCIIVGALTKLNIGEEQSPVTEALVFQPYSAVLEDVGTDNEHFKPNTGKYHLATMFSSIGAGQVWRLITPAFLHFGPIHLIFNLSWLYTLGFAIESRRGSWFFFCFVIGAAVFSNCAEALWTVYGFFNPTGYSSGGGFSGVNYALFGYVFLKGKLQPYEGLIVAPQTVGLMIGWLFVCMTGAVGPVANAAHVGGFAIGALVGAWPTLWRKMVTR